MRIFLLKPTDDSKSFCELIMFMAQVSHCYKEELKTLPTQVADMLDQHGQILAPPVRRVMVQALILLRNKNLISSVQILELFFKLFRCKDKALRSMLFTHIVTDIRQQNDQRRNNQLNRVLQNYMYTMIEDRDDTAATKSLEIMIALYKKNVWNDEKTVNIIANACLSSRPKVATIALHFFLSSDEEPEKEDDDDEDIDLRAVQFRNRVTKKTKKKATQLKRAKATMLKRNRRKNRAETFNFSAFHLINDPQGFAEKLLAKVRSSNAIFSLRLLIFNLISRLVGVHQLLLLNFYSFLQRYIKPHQEGAPIRPASFSASALVAGRPLPRAALLVLNSIREIVARCPLAMTEEIARDLARFKTYRDKGVMTAAKSLINLLREVNPLLLHKRDRGKTAQENIKTFQAPVYGDTGVMDFVPGADLLGNLSDFDDEDNDAAWDVQSESDSDSDDGEWIDVHHSDDEDHIVLSSDGELAGDNDDDDDDDEEEDADLAQLLGSAARKAKAAASELDALLAVGSDDEDILLSDEEPGGKAKAAKKKAAPSAADSEVNPKKRPISQLMEANRILTPADFAAIKQRKAEGDLDAATGKKAKRRRNTAIDPTRTTYEEAVNPESLMAYTKRQRATKEERLAAADAGREGREKYASRKGTKAHVGKTNLANSKNKPFAMLRQKAEVRGKNLRSFHERQLAERDMREKRLKGG
ncbi:hypothetical protein H696_05810 [Fonticula alba]|uniref:Protein SDA1 n=1 Tax=Fonticula alba TaxID=691883 RepID=A0A058Z2F2_FONAL|nr:hypothetical protein H696_05810 [Fonticula alba]KCV67702.1 hypothetical protein H696_05810 [Fonticula alba]|eukprot:XP_009497886.1 hypothetical protein H696_05810 [Fonticula alba]